MYRAQHVAASLQPKWHLPRSARLQTLLWTSALSVSYPAARARLHPKEAISCGWCKSPRRCIPRVRRPQPLKRSAALTYICVSLRALSWSIRRLLVLQRAVQRWVRDSHYYNRHAHLSGLPHERVADTSERAACMATTLSLVTTQHRPVAP